MALTNKSKSNITPQLKPKGIGASWGDLFATWGDASYGWGEIEVMTNKTKTSVTLTNKTKTNA